jgi:hypothetical protein
MRTGSDETDASNLSVLQIIPARFKTWVTRHNNHMERVFASPTTARACTHALTHTHTHTHTHTGTVGEGTLYLLF